MCREEPILGLKTSVQNDYITVFFKTMSFLLSFKNYAAFSKSLSFQLPHCLSQNNYMCHTVFLEKELSF